MNRLEFLTKLRNALERGGLPQNDIDDACSYYEEVFLDAGYGKDEETVASLGSPEDIARDILIESGIHADGDAEFIPEKAEANAQQDQTNSYTYGTSDNVAQSSKGSTTTAKLLLIILTFPLWIGPMAALFALSVAGIAIAFSLVIAFAAAGFGLVAAGISAMVHVPPLGLCLLGGGLICCGIFGLISRPAFTGLSRHVFGGIRKLVSKVHELINR